MTNAEKIRIIKHEILSLDANWYVRNEESDAIYFAFKESTGSKTCCLALIFFPLAILYALINIGSDGKNKIVNVTLLQDDKIHVSGDPKYALVVFDKLAENSHIRCFLEETKFIKKARITKIIGTVLTLIIIVLIISWVF